MVQLQQEQLKIGRRLKFSAMSYSLKENQLEVMVELTDGVRSCQGFCSGINTKSNSLRLFALATIEAVNHFLEPRSTIALEDVTQITLGNQDIVAAALTFCSGQTEEALAGCAIIRQDEKDAVIRATLAAVNRKIQI